MIRALVAAFAASLAFGCTTAPSKLVYINLRTQDCPHVYSTSLVEVALDPERFAGHCIGVAGYYRFGTLYLSEEDAQHPWGVVTLSISEEPGIREPPCDEGRLFLAGPFHFSEGSGILIPQHARAPNAEGHACIPAEPAA